jgi:hypothetical protein
MPTTSAKSDCDKRRCVLLLASHALCSQQLLSCVQDELKRREAELARKEKKMAKGACAMRLVLHACA